MRSTTDVRRSLQKYVAEALGSDWEVRSDDEQGMVTLPFCRVRRSAPTTMSGPSHTTDSVISFALHCTPVPAKTSADAYDEAERIEELLVRGFRVGVGAGRPARVPLYNYETIPPDNTSTIRGYADYMRVEQLTTQQLPDPDDPNCVNVVADLRLAWRRPGFRDTPTRLVTGVTVEPGP